MRLVFCLPGKIFSDKFLKCWTSTILWALKSQHQIMISNATSNNIYMVRAKCLGADVMRGISQKPFDGKIEYDYMIWIDSDTVWLPEHIEKLLSHNKDIVGALQAWEGGDAFTCGIWDEAAFSENASMPVLTPKDTDGKTELIEVGYIGFGLLAVKYGVFESINYPWFEPIITTLPGDIRDMAMEDVSWCRRVAAKGFSIYVDPTIRVGHEKTAVF